MSAVRIEGYISKTTSISAEIECAKIGASGGDFFKVVVNVFFLSGHFHRYGP